MQARRHPYPTGPTVPRAIMGRVTTVDREERLRHGGIAASSVPWVGHFCRNVVEWALRSQVGVTELEPTMSALCILVDRRDPRDGGAYRRPSRGLQTKMYSTASRLVNIGNLTLMYMFGIRTNHCPGSL
jgi:hypothetical protein